MTTKEQILDLLGHEPGGLSRSELYRRTRGMAEGQPCNPGTFRRTLGRLVASGEVTVAFERRNHGVGGDQLTAVHRLGSTQPIEGQLAIDNSDAT